MKIMNRILIALIISVLVAGCVHKNKEHDKPIAIHPDNPHYFIYKDKPTILITSGEHYGALMNLDFDYKTYFAELKRNKLNNTRTFSGLFTEHSEWFNIVDNTMACDSGRFVCPWARAREPGYINGGNKFDLSRWDTAYFSRLHDFMREADKNDVIVEMVLFSNYYHEHLWKYSPLHPDNNVNNINANIKVDEILDFKYPELYSIQAEYVKKMVKELNSYNNLYFEVCNEPYIRGYVNSEWQYALIDTIVKTEKRLPKKHLISINYRSRSHRIDSLHPEVFVYNFHYCSPPDAVAMNYDLDVVIGDNETGGRMVNDKDFVWEGWDFILAGGALFNNLDYSFTVEHPDGSRDVALSEPGGGSKQLRKELMHLQEFMNSFDFINMGPDTSTVKSKLTHRTVRMLSKPGKEYAIFVRPDPAKKKNVSVKFEAKLLPKHTGKHTFYLRCHDGAKVWFNGNLMLDLWKDGTWKDFNTGDFKYELTKDQPVDLVVEYYHKKHMAFIDFEWESEKISRQEIGTENYLTPDERKNGVKATLYNGAELGVFTDFDVLPDISYNASQSEIINEEKNNQLVMDVPAGKYRVEKISIETGTAELDTIQDIASKSKLKILVEEEELAIRIKKIDL